MPSHFKRDLLAASLIALSFHLLYLFLEPLTLIGLGVSPPIPHRGTGLEAVCILTMTKQFIARKYLVSLSSCWQPSITLT